MRITHLYLITTLSHCVAFAPPARKLSSPFHVESSTRLAAKSDMPTPLATDGDWSAYLDEETTGYGELVWGDVLLCILVCCVSDLQIHSFYCCVEYFHHHLSINIFLLFVCVVRCILVRVLTKCHLVISTLLSTSSILFQWSNRWKHMGETHPNISRR